MSVPRGNPKELCAVLDGECVRTPYGYAASTDERVLYVPHTKADDAAQAILLCRQQGIIRGKLEAMDASAADIVYATTLATAIPES